MAGPTTRKRRRPVGARRVYPRADPARAGATCRIGEPLVAVCTVEVRASKRTDESSSLVPLSPGRNETASVRAHAQQSQVRCRTYAVRGRGSSTFVLGDRLAGHRRRRRREAVGAAKGRRGVRVDELGAGKSRATRLRCSLNAREKARRAVCRAGGESSALTLNRVPQMFSQIKKALNQVCPIL